MQIPVPDDRLVHLATYADPMRAAIARGVLEQQGVQATVGHDTVNTAIGYVGSALGGVRLYVNEKDQEQALDVLRSAGDGADDRSLATDSDCDSVDEDHERSDGDELGDFEPAPVAGSHPALKYAFRGAVIGVCSPFFVLPTAYSVYLTCRHQLWRADRGGNDWRFYVALLANVCAVLLARIFYTW
ncbi:MAG: DUF2007 domain-containing protein [Lacipirellulaceae bacterium]